MPQGFHWLPWRPSSKPTPPNEKPPPMARVCHLVGPGGFEPPTSTMSRPIGRTKTRVDVPTLVACWYGRQLCQPTTHGKVKTKSTKVKCGPAGLKYHIAVHKDHGISAACYLPFRTLLTLGACATLSLSAHQIFWIRQWRVPTKLR